MNLKRIIKISMFSAMIIISVILLPPITVPIIMVPLTLQLFVIVLIGYSLRPLDAFLSVMIYVLLGIVGLPVFSQGQSGLSAVLGPTGGFIMMFPLVALGISLLKSKKGHMIYDLMIGVLIGIIALYVIASLWLTYVLNLTFLQGLIPLLIFIPIDLIKIGLAYVVYQKIPKDLLI
jgi:biotin transport system substrate-specific component